MVFGALDAQSELDVQDLLRKVWTEASHKTASNTQNC